ncbi:protein transport protein bet1 [Sporothrix epigloea]|uniref:Protein transport protein bet1 n=1 Tax=Sporothrix epigloea TaxID=1892477 RepID=A0ABP0D5D3_9PEZI
MASSRFGSSNLHQRDPRSALFEGYVGPGADTNGHANQRNTNASPNRFGTPGSSAGGYGYGYPGGSGSSLTPQNGGYRSATPNRRGQYSDAVLNELESQNDQQIEGILGKVRILKDMTVAIGDEIRDSSALAEKMNDTFDATRVRLRGTMNRMLLMAERTGVGWRVWLGFFAAVALLFTYVWLF